MNFFRRLFFSLWYFRRPPWDTNIVPPEVHDFIATHPPGKALDLGCGTGTNAIELAKHNWQVTGVDFAPNAIFSAKQKAKAAQLWVDFRVRDVTKLDGIAGPFDLILDIGCYHNLLPEGMEIYRNNIKRLLRSQGKFLLYAFFREKPDKPGSGLVEADLEAFSPPLTLVSRADGQERGSRPSVWVTFRKD
jgi:cyclopropane fatty-acyl-phospholipid synthase-like methyltransferase